MINSYEDALSFVHGRGQFKKIPTLKRMQYFAEQLGNPQDQIKPIHVAGTNGKGSTVAYLRSLFEQQNLTVGTFTSPFLVTFNERISVNGIPISDEMVVELVQQIKPVVDRLDAELPEGGPTEFEIVTAMMFVYFAKHPVDVVIVEVGLGGLYDSTNIVNPAISVITTIGYDHMKILGDTLPKIAAQKAGIIKAGAPVVLGDIDSEALPTIEQTANRLRSPVRRLGRDFSYRVLGETQSEERFDYQSGGYEITGVTTGLLGQYQVANATTAIAAFLLYQEQRNQMVTKDSVRNGIAKTTWGGRFEVIVNHPNQPKVVIDGAHNIPAVQAVKQTLITRFGKQRIAILLSILADKQSQAMISELLTLPNVDLYLTTFAAPNNRQTMPLDTLIQTFDNKRVIVAKNWQSELANLMDSNEYDLVLVTGSLYFISDVRDWLIK